MDEQGTLKAHRLVQYYGIVLLPIDLLDILDRNMTLHQINIDNPHATRAHT